LHQVSRALNGLRLGGDEGEGDGASGNGGSGRAARIELAAPLSTPKAVKLDSTKDRPDS